MQYPEYLPYRQKKRRLIFILAGLALAGLIGGLVLLDIPRYRRALSWRADIALTYIRGVLNPVPDLPTPAVAVQPNIEVVTPTLEVPAAAP